jgi:ABC-type Fe3+ transport system substrate-binding protein
MKHQPQRRRAIGAGIAVLCASLLGAAPALVASATQSPAKQGAQPREETRTLDALYQDAIAEGGDLVVYAGGDVPAQQEATKRAFLARFPRINLTMIVDYSKFHDVRVDNQLATGGPIADVVQLQTLHDFERWKKQGRLLPYKPAGFSKVYRGFKDPDGTWSAIGVIAFSYMVDPAIGSDAPASPKALADPAWAGKIASSYPSDDDAALYLYKLYAEAYGWDWIAKLAAQNIQFARGTNTPGAAVGAHQKAVGIAGSGSLTAPASAPVKWMVTQGHPFLGWGQRAAILKDARHTAAAKLYMNWQLSTARQEAAFNGWSVRTDVHPAGGLKPIWEYPDAHVADFAAFMADRAEAERWRLTFALYFGEVKGDPSPGWFGLRPGQ